MSPLEILVLSLPTSARLAERVTELIEAPGRRAFHLTHQVLTRSPGGSLAAEPAPPHLGVNPGLVLACLPPDSPSSVDAVRQWARENRWTCDVLLVVEAAPRCAFRELLDLGLSEFCLVPLNGGDLLPRLLRIQGETRAAEPGFRELKEKLGLAQFVGDSPALIEEIRKIPQLARCDASVLVLGETGTGKEICARSIHYLSPRAAAPFVPVNCGAIPVDLVESELFGHEAGAYTGANSAAAGLVREADGGTLFLDEVDCLPLSSQVKLLRFLQEKEFRPVGGRKQARADVRMVAASNVSLAAAVRAGRFRPDLYYRLNVLRLVLPPLRERREDIPVLARHFLAKYSAQFGKAVSGLSAGTLASLMLHDWPGNIRELENAIERAVVLAEGSIIRTGEIVLETETPPAERSFRHLKARAVAQFERAYLEAVLRENNGNISAAARAAEKNRRAFWALLRKHQLLVRQPTAAA